MGLAYSGAFVAIVGAILIIAVITELLRRLPYARYGVACRGVSTKALRSGAGHGRINYEFTVQYEAADGIHAVQISGSLPEGEQSVGRAFELLYLSKKPWRAVLASRLEYKKLVTGMSIAGIACLAVGIALFVIGRIRLI